MNFPLPFHEFHFEATRSRGAGGQHVNRTESAVILNWNIKDSLSIPENIKSKLLFRLGSQLTTEGVLQIRSEEFRSQKQNKDLCIEKLLSLISRALHEPKKRVKTKPTRSSQRKRIETKRLNSKIKQNRARVRGED